MNRPEVDTVDSPLYALAQHSDIGGRAENQDRVGHRIGKFGLIMALADGLGGHAGGALAADTLVNTMLWRYDTLSDRLIKNPYRFIVDSVIHAHRMIAHRALSEGYDTDSPKTTGVICLVQNGYAYWGHIGDSRLYHYRAGALVHRSEDHTDSERKRKEGLISEDDMRLAAHQAPLNRCVGGRRRSIVTLGLETPLDRGDLILICSDGVWRAMDARGLYRQVSQFGLTDGVEKLSLAARKQFKQQCDNTTSIALRWDHDRTQLKPLQPAYLTESDQTKLWKQPRTKTPDDKITGTSSLADEIAEVDREISDMESFVDRFSDAR